MNIETYQFNTSMGTGDADKLPFLSPEQAKELNLIGYSGKNSKGERTTREKYLNSLNIGTFKVEQTKYDNGDFQESFYIIHATFDLFEYYYLQPPELLAITDKWGEKCETDFTYLQCEEFKAEVNAIGYTFDYYLDGQPYFLRKINT